MSEPLPPKPHRYSRIFRSRLFFWFFWRDLHAMREEAVHRFKVRNLLDMIEKKKMLAANQMVEDAIQQGKARQQKQEKKQNP